MGIILGSGLGDFAQNFSSISIPYADIPDFETSSVKGHKGQLVFAEIFGKKVVMMQGRCHFYETNSTTAYTSDPVGSLKQTTL